MSNPEFDIQWIDGKREPQCAPDPRYPHGINLDLTTGDRPACEAAVPYPAQRCGVYVITCSRCGKSASCTTAGRADDPATVRIACAPRGSA